MKESDLKSGYPYIGRSKPVRGAPDRKRTVRRLLRTVRFGGRVYVRYANVLRDGSEPVHRWIILLSSFAVWADEKWKGQDR